MKKITVLQYIYVVIVTLLVGIPAILAGSLQRGLARKGRVFRIVSKVYARALFGAFGVRVESVGIDRIDPGAPYVFMARHTSIADPLAVALALSHPLHFVFKREFARIPVFGWALTCLGQIVVDREDRDQAKASLDTAASGVSGNSSVVIFPEGRVSPDGALQPLKKGGFHLALQTGFPIAPLRIEGARLVCPPRGSGHFHPGVIRVAVLPPIPVAGAKEGDIPALMESVRSLLL